jgi:hypothetical protein
MLPQVAASRGAGGSSSSAARSWCSTAECVRLRAYTCVDTAHRVRRWRSSLGRRELRPRRQHLQQCRVSVKRQRQEAQGDRADVVRDRHWSRGVRICDAVAQCTQELDVLQLETSTCQRHDDRSDHNHSKRPAHARRRYQHKREQTYRVNGGAPNVCQLEECLIERSCVEEVARCTERCVGLPVVKPARCIWSAKRSLAKHSVATPQARSKDSAATSTLQYSNQSHAHHAAASAERHPPLAPDNITAQDDTTSSARTRWTPRSRPTRLTRRLSKLEGATCSSCHRKSCLRTGNI